MYKTKVCCQCKKRKLLKYFVKNRTQSKDGHKNNCRNCSRKAVMNSATKKRYFMSYDDYKLLLKNSKCKICHSKRRLTMDHDHNTGKVREPLCGTCNSMLGFARDNIKILKNAVKYLERHKFGR